MSVLDAVLAEITAERLREAVHAVTAIPSPTGREAPLARLLAQRLGAAGWAATTQHLDEHQANAAGRLRGSGGGEDLMLYAPIDTFTTGDPDLDVPWIGPELRSDMLPEPRDEGPFVSGLGASNPKGHAACILVLAEALGRVRPELDGDLVAAFGAGGMPANAVEAPGFPARANTGQGVGCSFLLERGWVTDHAVIAKPGDFVAHEEVGLCWFEVTVPGIHTYAGSRHRLPYRNPIVTAAEVVTRLEGWLAGYPERHRTGTALPQGIIGSIAGGWERLLAATPAACRIRLDIRIAAGMAPLELKRELTAFTTRLSAELGTDLGVEMVLAIPGTHTPPDAPVVRGAIAAWEAANGRKHEPVPGNSGATDANILRARGIPTARVGMPKVRSDEFDVDFSRGMNTVDIAAMRRLCEVLARTALKITTKGPA
ncbi:M20 family metallopeptidase [Amycolatopsis jiangsuensis]|uniref:Acetylornithine deacetylase/succinyl-diaminopimelate desuccinylase-like protein n=1 Tax=Amycolatopsis jiangsuensis TaxID=1181879 RepID=A0A840IS98_9PSEU|nr:deacylase [Amycolatopsis jiangsuensis]MBB4683884.1 acetylornithine deacetylase/succinyl-diaminopimelate desuccinylase-like protein [Amycolatopsis jiangsuensis]